MLYQLNFEKIRILPKILLWTFFLLFCLHVVVSVIAVVTGHDYMYGTLRLVYFDSEQNLPTFFSSFILLIAAFLLFSIYQMQKISYSSDSRYWLSLTIIFFLLAIDEFAGIHELTARPLRDALGITDGWLYFTWIIIGVIVVLLFVVCFLRFFLAFNIRFKLLFGISALLFIFGSIGMELLGGYFRPDEEIVVLVNHVSLDIPFLIITTIEESMEMLGIILFIWSIIQYLLHEIANGKIVTEKLIQQDL